MSLKGLFIFILLVGGVWAGIFFKDEVGEIYNSFIAQVENFKYAEIGSIVPQAGKEIFSPRPLRIGGPESGAVLLQSKIIEETNLQRKNNGNLLPLAENSRLNAAAEAKANNMLLKQYFEHISPSGVDAGSLVQSFGYEYIVAGENLILGNFFSEKELVQAWMDSPGHRANILNGKYKEIGVAIIKGIYNGESVWMGVQEFGLSLSSCPSPDAVLKTKIDLDNAQLDFFNTQINEKKNAIENTDKKSPVYNQMLHDYNQLIGQYNSLAESVKNNIANYNIQVNNFNNCVNEK